MSSKTLSINVKAGDQATAVLRNINAAVLNVGVTVEKAGDKAHEFGDKFEKTLERVKHILEAVFAFELLKKGLEILDQTAESLDQIAKMARRLGVDGQKLSVLKYQADLADVDFQSLGKSIKFAQKNLSEFVETGGGKYAEWAKRFNLNLTDEKGHLRDVLELLPDLADRLNALTPGEATEASTAIFGKAGNSMLQLFRLGGDEMKRLAQEAHALNVDFTKDQLDAAERMVDATKRVGAAWLGVKAQIMTAVEPAITPLLNAVAQRLAALPDITRTVGENVAKAISGDGQARGKIKEFFDALFDLGTEALVQGTRLLFTALLAAVRAGWALIEPDIARVGNDLIHSITGGLMGTKDTTTEQIQIVKGKIQELAASVIQQRKIIAAGDAPDFMQFNLDATEHNLAEARAKLEHLLKDPGKRIDAELVSIMDDLKESAKSSAAALDPLVARVARTAEALGKVKEHTQEHTFQTGHGETPEEKVGEDSETAAGRVNKLKDALAELGAMMEELDARGMASGDERAVERVRLAIQQRKEATQVLQKFAELGDRDIPKDYLTKLAAVHQQELKVFDVQTDSLQLLQNLDLAEKDYKLSLQDRADAVAAGQITQVKANALNRQSLNELLATTSAVRDNIRSLVDTNPELATKLIPQLEKASLAVADVRRSLNAIPENSFVGGATAALRDLKNESEDFFKVGREGTQQLAQGFTGGLAGAIVATMARTQQFGKAVKQVLASTLQQVSQLILQFLLLRAVMGIASMFTAGPTMTTGHAAAGVRQIPDLAGPGIGVFANTGAYIRDIPRSRRFDRGGIWRGVDANYDSGILAVGGGEGVLRRSAMRRLGEANLAYANAGGTLVPARGAVSGPEIHNHFNIAPGAQVNATSVRQIEEAAQRGVLAGLRTNGNYRDRMREVLR